MLLRGLDFTENSYGHIYFYVMSLLSEIDLHDIYYVQNIHLSFSLSSDAFLTIMVFSAPS